MLGADEICKIRGGNSYGDLGFKSNTTSAERISNSLASGNMGCTNFNSPQLNALGYTGTNLKIEGTSAGTNRIQVRIYATSFVDDGPNRKKHIPITDKQVFALIFKDISDAIGLKDIPIQVNRAE